MKWSMLVLSIFLLFAVVKAVPYNKYGRSCRDILCIPGEECVMENDACTAYSDKCGSFPNCKRKASAAKRGCASMKCDTGHFCSLRQENCARPPCEIKPVCIAFRTASATKTSTGTKLQSSNQHGYNYGQNYNRNSWSWGSG